MTAAERCNRPSGPILPQAPTGTEQPPWSSASRGRREDERVKDLVNLGRQAESVQPGCRKHDGVKTALGGAGQTAGHIAADRNDNEVRAQRADLGDAPGGAGSHAGTFRKAFKGAPAQHVAYVFSGAGGGEQRRAFAHGSGEVLQRMHDHVDLPCHQCLFLVG
ncbi:hypothetical protein GCM10022245_49390 [Streptomyces mayteni]